MSDMPSINSGSSIAQALSAQNSHTTSQIKNNAVGEEATEAIDNAAEEAMEAGQASISISPNKAIGSNINLVV